MTHHQPGFSALLQENDQGLYISWQITGQFRKCQSRLQAKKIFLMKKFRDMLANMMLDEFYRMWARAENCVDY